MDYKKAYEKAIEHLISEEGCPNPLPGDRKMDAACMKCLTADHDTYEQKKACWKNLFETE